MTDDLYLIKRKKFNDYLYYPDCDLSRILCKLMKVTAIPEDRLPILKEMGWDVGIQECINDKIKALKKEKEMSTL